MTAKAACLALLLLTAPDVGPDALPVCVAVAVEAERQAVPVDLAIAVAWYESRLRADVTSTAGCVGPMQVDPEHHCDGGVADGCDLVSAGVAVLARYADESLMMSGSVDWHRALCRYATGTPYGECRWSTSRLDLAAKVRGVVDVATMVASVDTGQDVCGVG